VEGQEIHGLLDTGASRCILDWETAVRAGLHQLSGRVARRALGGNVFNGYTHELQLLLPADDGLDLVLATSVWASEAFKGPNLIGYGGLLEKIRFALDPQSNLFYFGA
jgi:hypothetical protein